MAKTRVLVEFGMGTSLRRMDYTEAATNAGDQGCAVAQFGQHGRTVRLSERGDDH